MNRQYSIQSSSLLHQWGNLLMQDIPLYGNICMIIIVVLMIAIILIFVKPLDKLKKNYQISQAIKVNQQHIEPPLIRFRDFFESNIKPTFSQFAYEYYNNINNIQSKFRLSRQDQITQQEKLYIQRIFQKLCKIDKSHIYENIKIDNNDTSYTIDKKNVYMCLNNHQEQEGQITKEPTDIDVLVFVFLHECSHIACQDPEHSYDFWCIFRLILDIFCNYEQRVYKDLRLCTLDMDKAPIRYCNNMKITYNPLFDSNTFMTFKERH